jgi:hypothetical protein
MSERILTKADLKHVKPLPRGRFELPRAPARKSGELSTIARGGRPRQETPAAPAPPIGKPVPDLNEWPYSAIGLVLTYVEPDDDLPTYVSTGFLISGRHVLTTGRALWTEDTHDYYPKVSFRPKFGLFEVQYVANAKWVHNAFTQYATHSIEYDYGVFKLPVDLGDTSGSIGLMYNQQVPIGNQLAGYPANSIYGPENYYELHWSWTLAPLWTNELGIVASVGYPSDYGDVHSIISKDDGSPWLWPTDSIVPGSPGHNSPGQVAAGMTAGPYINPNTNPPTLVGVAGPRFNDTFKAFVEDKLGQ